jgi:hypothetical protein
MDPLNGNMGSDGLAILTLLRASFQVWCVSPKS